MKKTALLILALAVGAGALRAQESSYSITLDFNYVNEYVFRGQKFAGHTLHPSIEFAAGDFYAGIWAAEPFRSAYDREYDYYVGYGIAIDDTWSIDFGATYYSYPGVGGNQFEPYVGIAGEMGDFSTSFYLYYETEFKVTTGQVSLGYSVPVSEQVTFDLSGELGYTDYKGGSNLYWGVGGMLNFALNDKASAYLGANIAGTDISGSKTYAWVSTGITIGF
jgi:uncharacterized protein (TIGR02001 family)